MDEYLKLSRSWCNDISCGRITLRQTQSYTSADVTENPVNSNKNSFFGPEVKLGSCQAAAACQRARHIARRCVDSCICIPDNVNVLFEVIADGIADAFCIQNMSRPVITIDQGDVELACALQAAGGLRQPSAASLIPKAGPGQGWNECHAIDIWLCPYLHLLQVLQLCPSINSR